MDKYADQLHYPYHKYPYHRKSHSSAKRKACHSTPLYTATVEDSTKELVQKIAYDRSGPTKLFNHHKNSDLLLNGTPRLIFRNLDSERMGLGERVMVAEGKVIAVKEGAGNDCQWDS